MEMPHAIVLNLARIYGMWSLQQIVTSVALRIYKIRMELLPRNTCLFCWTWKRVQYQKDFYAERKFEEILYFARFHPPRTAKKEKPAARPLSHATAPPARPPAASNHHATLAPHPWHSLAPGSPGHCMRGART